MIGQLINKFENSTDQTLGAFNKMFQTELEGNIAEEVEIGAMRVGGRRVVMVGEKEHLLEIRDQYETKIHNVAKVFVYNVKKGGELYATLNTKSEVASYFKTHQSSIVRAIKDDKLLQGYSIKQIAVDTRVKTKKASKIFKKFIKGRTFGIKKAYTFTKNGIGVSYVGLEHASKYTGLSISSISKCIKNGKKAKGYKIIVTSLR